MLLGSSLMGTGSAPFTTGRSSMSALRSSCAQLFPMPDFRRCNHDYDECFLRPPTISFQKLSYSSQGNYRVGAAAAEPSAGQVP